MNSLDNIISQMQERFNVEIDTSVSLAQLNVDTYNRTDGNLNEIDGYNCKICRNKGFTARLDENNNELYAVCKCHMIRAVLKRAIRSGLGDIIKEYTFEKYDDAEDWQKTIKKKAMAFCADDNAKWFYMGGQVGSGKTFICTAIAAHYIKAGREVKYMLWCEESKNLKAIVNDVSYQEAISTYKDVDVLYIDDFLKVRNGETPTAADINLAFEIINHRLLDNKMITIISSEKLLDELLEYDEATMSRIYQKTGEYKINVARDKKKNYRLR